jgi:hypothetical protein
VLTEFRGRTGIAEGSGLFVVHAQREKPARDLVVGNIILQDQVLATFLSPANRTRVDAISMQGAQARAKREAIENRALQFDESLLQEQAHVQAETTQLKGFAFELRKSLYEIERGQIELCTVWTREESQLGESIELAKPS